MKPRRKTVIELVDKFGHNAANSHGRRIQLQRLSDEDLKLFVALIANNSDITDLILSGSHIGDEGVLMLAEALKKNTKLVSLQLADTGMTDIGARALIKMLQVNQTLSDINVKFNFIELHLMEQMQMLLDANRKFQEIISQDRKTIALH